DLVPLVGRIRNAVGEKQHVHRQARPRAMKGPKKLATGSGRRLHTSVISRYLGFSGFRSGMAWPSASRYSYVSGVGSKPQFFLKSHAPVPTFERPKSKLAQPRSTACSISFQYMWSLARHLRASNTPPP